MHPQNDVTRTRKGLEGLLYHVVSCCNLKSFGGLNDQKFGESKVFPHIQQRPPPDRPSGSQHPLQHQPKRRDGYTTQRTSAVKENSCANLLDIIS